MSSPSRSSSSAVLPLAMIIAFFPLVDLSCRVKPVFEICSCVSSNTGMCTVQKDEGKCRLDEFSDYVEQLEIYGEICRSTRSDLETISYGSVTLHNDYCLGLPRCRCVSYFLNDTNVKNTSESVNLQLFFFVFGFGFNILCVFICTSADQNSIQLTTPQE